MILSPEDALDGLQNAINLVKKAQAVAKDLGGLGRCVRWAWTGDVYNRKVVCLEWQKVEKK